MKLIATGNRLAALLIAALMIGCSGPESNSPGASAEAPGAAGASNEGYSARDSSAAGGGAEAAEAAEAADVAEAEPAAEIGSPTSGEPAAAASPTVLFVGTSLTAGLGVAQEQSFPLVIQRRIDEADLPYRVVNAGVSGETSAGALARIDWLLRQPFDAVVLETGANDMLRGVDPETTEANIQSIIDRIRAERPGVPIVLAGMIALPNLGQTYAREFQAIYPRLAQRNDVPLIPFLLEGVGGERAMNQSDGVHPNAEGHRIVADTVWRVLEPVLVELEAESEADAP